MDNADYYKHIPMRLEISTDPKNGLYKAVFVELPGFVAYGKSLKEAIAGAEAQKGNWYEHKRNSDSSNEKIDTGVLHYTSHEHDSIDEYFPDRKPLRVASYIREAVPNNGLRSPIDLQKHLYETVICGHPGWILAGIYIDTGNSMLLANRPGLVALLGDCRAGKIDVVICKNMNRIYRNIKPLLELINEFAQMDPPVAIYFEAEDTISMSMLELYRN